MILFRKLYDVLRSTKLALALLLVILCACVIGVTAFPAGKSKALIFSSLWFNGLLVLLVLNVGFCFFGRIWRRKVTLISIGMILFHLSFVALFLGIVYDSLFYFTGAIRLTEGETLDMAEPRSYDRAAWGRFFDHDAKLKGQITLHRLYPRYEVKGENKGVANEITVGAPPDIKRGMTYVTGHVTHRGMKYYRKKDGFSPLIILRDKDGNELFGAYSPIQSLKQADGTYLYTTGTAQGPGTIPFPQIPGEHPLIDLQFTYYPDKEKDRTGEVLFQVQQFNPGSHADMPGERYKEKAAFGEKVKAGDYFLSLNEVRYWASLDVHYNPGLPVILTSFWIGLGGMVLTTGARFAQKKEQEGQGFS